MLIAEGCLRVRKFLDGEAFFAIDTWSSQSLPVSLTGVQHDILTNKSQFADFFALDVSELEVMDDGDEDLQQHVDVVNRHILQGDVRWRRCPQWLLRVS